MRFDEDGHFGIFFAFNINFFHCFIHLSFILIFGSQMVLKAQKRAYLNLYIYKRHRQAPTQKCKNKNTLKISIELYYNFNTANLYSSIDIVNGFQNFMAFSVIKIGGFIVKRRNSESNTIKYLIVSSKIAQQN